MAPCMATLIKLKADVTTQDKDGNTLLHYAAAMDSIEICKLLLTSKIDASVANRDGQSPAELITVTNRDLAELFDIKPAEE